MFSPTVFARIAITAGFWVALAFCVLTYGGSNAFSVTIASIMVYGMLPAAFLVSGMPTTTRLPLRAGFAVVVFCGAWVSMQSLALPAEMFANPLWAEAARIAPDSMPVVSINPGDMPLAFLKIALPFGFLMNALLLFDTDERALRALKVIGIAGGFIAIASIFQFVAFPNSLLFGEKKFYLDSLTGPFINRNTAGTFFGVLCILLLALSRASLDKIGLRNLWMAMQSGDRSGQSRAIWDLALLALCCLACFMALLLTKSRAATGATLAAMLLLAWLLSSGQRHVDGKRSGTGWRLGALFGSVFAVAVAFALFGGRVFLRGQVQGYDDVRFCIYPGLAAAMRDHWPIGAGLSSFRDLFPQYRDAACGTYAIWDRAHNFYAEGLITMGAGFLAVLIPAVAILLVAYRRGSRQRRRFHFVSSIGFATLLLVALHSFFDFSLQIPGFAAFFAALSAPLLTICLRSPGR